MVTLVRDDLGAEVSSARRPRRLVSLVPNLSETLWTWGLGERLVGVTDWCVEPPEGFPRSERVRGTKNPDVGRIVELAPDLVLANEEENRERDVRRLRDAGLAVAVTRVRTVSDAAGSLERVGHLVGEPSAGRDLAARIRGAARRSSASGGRRRRVFCAVWRDTSSVDGNAPRWWSLGRDTFGGDLLATCGLDVVPPDPGARYPVRSLSKVAAWQPELVLLPDEPYAFGHGDRDALADWRAEVVFVDGQSLWWWGPRTPAALDALAGRRWSALEPGAGGQ